MITVISISFFIMSIGILLIGVALILDVTKNEKK
jgi:hypothetical protein